MPGTLSVDTSQIIRSIVQSVAQADFSRNPFAHFQMKNIFPADVYQLMVDDFPPAEVYHELRHKDALRPDGTSTRTMLEFFDDEFARLNDRQRKLWSSIRDALYSPEVKEAIFSHFREEIQARIEHEKQPLRLEKGDDFFVEAYPRPGLYRDAAGYKITPHPDTPLKVVTVQFYLPRDDRQSLLGTSLYRRKTLVERAAAPLSGKYKEVKKLSFLPNTGYGFAVTEDSWHGRDTIADADGDRYSILLFYLREDVRLNY
jgi:hypothetical protein